jgi:hypothetical protein
LFYFNNNIFQTTFVALYNKGNEHLKGIKGNCVWWHIPVFPAVKRIRQEDCMFKASLGNIARPYIKKKKRGMKGKGV